ncbi:nitronate monooxygenase [soil metagenome]
MSLPSSLRARLAVPAIAAPMTAVSGLELVLAACRAGVIGAFPVHNAHRSGGLQTWLTTLRAEIGPDDAPFAANLIVHPSNRRRREEVAALAAHGVELVITSVGSPAEFVAPLHDAGAVVYADVASIHHAHRALEAGVDGLVLLTAGAGGQTGWANPFAFVRAVREFHSGPLVLAGGITDGASIRAAEVLGADLAYLGTRFIAATESLAQPDYRRAVIEAGLDDIVTSNVVGGIPANLTRAWLGQHEFAAQQQADGYGQDRLLSWETVHSAGHSVSGVHREQSVAGLVADLHDRYRQTIADYDVAGRSIGRKQ